MNGFRTIGSKKTKLLNRLNSALTAIGKQGIDPRKYLKKKYELKNYHDIANLPTKMISGVISDVMELSRK